MSSKAPSRGTRFSDAQSLVSDAKNVFEELRDELQSWLDGMPENLQSGSKADQLNDAISSLESVIDACDTIEGESPEFPGMF